MLRTNLVKRDVNRNRNRSHGQNNKYLDYKTKQASSALRIKRLSIAKRIAPDFNYIKNYIAEFGFGHGGCGAGSKEKLKKKENARQIMERNFFQEEYRNYYEREIGLYGKFYYFIRPRHSIRIIWNGNDLCSTTLVPLENYPDWLVKHLPSGTALDGFLCLSNECSSNCEEYEETLSELLFGNGDWQKVKDKVHYCVFDILITGLSFSDRHRRLEILQKKQFQNNRYITNTSLCKFGENVITDIYKEFKKIIETFDLLQCNEKLYFIRAESHLYNNKDSRKDFFQICKQSKGEGKIIGLCEGLNKYYGRLGKFKCIHPVSKRIFYVGKGIPEDIRNCFRFERTTLVQVLSSPKYDKKDLPNINDIIYYAASDILPSGSPREAIYVGFTKKST